MWYMDLPWQEHCFLNSAGIAHQNYHNNLLSQQHCRNPLGNPHQNWTLSNFIWCHCWHRWPFALHCYFDLLIMCVMEKSLPCLVAVYIFIIMNWLLIHYFSVEFFTGFYWYNSSLHSKERSLWSTVCCKVSPVNCLSFGFVYFLSKSLNHFFFFFAKLINIFLC